MLRWRPPRRSAACQELCGTWFASSTAIPFPRHKGEPIDTLRKSPLPRQNTVHRDGPKRLPGTCSGFGGTTRARSRSSGRRFGRRLRALWSRRRARPATFAHAATDDLTGPAATSARQISEPAATTRSGPNSDPEPQAHAALTESPDAACTAVGRSQGRVQLAGIMRLGGWLMRFT